MTFARSVYRRSSHFALRWVENECVRSKLNNHKTNSHKTGLILLALMSLTKLWGQLVLFCVGEEFSVEHVCIPYELGRTSIMTTANDLQPQN